MGAGKTTYTQMVPLDGDVDDSEFTPVNLKAADDQWDKNAQTAQNLAAEQASIEQFEAAVDIVKARFKVEVSHGHTYHRKHYNGSIETPTLTAASIDDFKTKFAHDKSAQAIIVALAKTLQHNGKLDFTTEAAKANKNQGFFKKNTAFNPNMAVLILLNELPEDDRPAQSNLASLARIALQSQTWHTGKAEEAQTKAQTGQNIKISTGIGVIIFIAWLASREDASLSLGSTADGYLFVGALFLLIGSFVFGSAMRDKARDSVAVEENTAVSKLSLTDYASAGRDHGLAAAIEPVHDEIQGQAPMFVGQ